MRFGVLRVVSGGVVDVSSHQFAMLHCHLFGQFQGIAIDPLKVILAVDHSKLLTMRVVLKMGLASWGHLVGIWDLVTTITTGY